MRVSQAYTQDIFLRNLRKVKAQLDEALARSSSGKRVRFASDDPAAAGELLRLADEAQKLTARQHGLSQARPWLQLTEQAVTELSTVLISAQQTAIQGASETMKPEQMKALAEAIRGLRQQVSGLTELRVSGRFIFSGTQTTTNPYDAAGVYQGNDRRIEVPIDDVTVAISLPADDVFGEITNPGDATTPPAGTGAMGVLAQLEWAMDHGDQAMVRSLLDPLRNVITDNSAMLAHIGTQRKILEDGDLRLADRRLAVESRAADLGAADMAEALSDVAMFQTNYSVTLQAGAQLYGPNFFDYLG